MELSEHFACLGDWLSFSVPRWRTEKKMLGCGLLGGIITQADTMVIFQELR